MSATVWSFVAAAALLLLSILGICAGYFLSHSRNKEKPVTRAKRDPDVSHKPDPQENHLF